MVPLYMIICNKRGSIFSLSNIYNYANAFNVWLVPLLNELIQLSTWLILLYVLSVITLLLGLRLLIRVAKCSIISKFSQLIRVSSARSAVRILWLFIDFIVFLSTCISKSSLNLFIEFMSKGGQIWGRFIEASFSNHSFSSITLFWISFSWWILLRKLISFLCSTFPFMITASYLFSFLSRVSKAVSQSVRGINYGSPTRFCFSDDVVVFTYLIFSATLTFGVFRNIFFERGRLQNFTGS